MADLVDQPKTLPGAEPESLLTEVKDLVQPAPLLPPKSVNVDDVRKELKFELNKPEVKANTPVDGEFSTVAEPLEGTNPAGTSIQIPVELLSPALDKNLSTEPLISQIIGTFDSELARSITNGDDLIRAADSIRNYLVNTAEEFGIINELSQRSFLAGPAMETLKVLGPITDKIVARLREYRYGGPDATPLPYAMMPFEDGPFEGINPVTVPDFLTAALTEQDVQNGMPSDLRDRLAMEHINTLLSTIGGFEGRQIDPNALAGLTYSQKSVLLGVLLEASRISGPSELTPTP